MTEIYTKEQRMSSNQVPSAATQQALDLMLNGKSVPENLDHLGEAHAAFEAEPAEVTPEIQEPAEGAIEASEEGIEGQEPTEEGVALDAVEPEEGITSEDFETIKVSGRDLKIDWNDRDAIKKALSFSGAYRDEKRGKDMALSKLQDFEGKMSESTGEVDRLSGILKEIETAKEAGPEAVIQALFNRDMSSFMEEAAERAGWSEEKQDSYAKALQVKALEAKMKAMEDSASAKEESARELKESANLKQVQNHFEASYRSHSLDGALGDPILEDELDERMFDKVKAQFNNKDISDISPADIEKAMRLERARLLKTYGKVSSKRASADIERRKKAALSKAQATASRGNPSIGAEKKVAEIMTGNRPNSWREILDNPDLLKQL